MLNWRKTPMIMKSALLPWLGSAFRRSLAGPLTVLETGALGSVLLLIGTVYCQLYCLIAFQMHGQSMPLSASVHRVSIDILPAFLAFELSKRALQRGKTPFRITGVIFIFAVAIVVATIARTTLEVMTPPWDSFRKMFADRLQIIGLAILILIWMQLRATRSSLLQTEGAHSDQIAKLPPAKFIHSIRAAGNYVEIHFGGQTSLVRMPLKEAADRLPPKQFVRVHRSLIVNRAFIASQNGRRSIRLNDGTEVRIGDAYRPNLPAP